MQSNPSFINKVNIMENSEAVSTEAPSVGTLPARSALVNRQIELETELQRVTNAIAILDGQKVKSRRGRPRQRIEDAPAAPAFTVDHALATAKRLSGDRIDLRTKEGRFLLQERVVDSKGHVVVPATEEAVAV